MASKVRLVPIQDVGDLEQVTADIQAVIDEEVAGAVELLYRVKIEVIQAEDRLNSNRAVITFIDQTATGIVIQNPSVRVFSVPNIEDAPEVVNQVILEEEDPVSDKYIVGAPEFSVVGDELNRAAAVVILTFGVVSNSGGGGGIPGVRVLDEGALVGTFVGMNFTGSVTATDQGGGDAQIDIPASTDEQARVSATDTTSGYLSAKIVPESSKLAFTVLNSGANEQLQIGVSESNIDHDALANYVANEHVDHSLVSIGTAAGSALTGGGDLSATRALSLDIDGLPELVSVAAGDTVVVYDVSEGEFRKVQQSNFTGGVGTDEQVKVSAADTSAGYLSAKLVSADSKLSVNILNPGAVEQYQLAVEEGNIDHDALSNYVANQHVDHSSVSVATGVDSGLSGGGDLTATRNLSVDIVGTTSESTAANDDLILIYDASETALRSMSRSDFLSGISGADELVKVSAADTTAGFLSAKVSSANDRLGITIANPAANEGLLLTLEESNIVHDNLSGYVANEHVDHSLVSVATAADSGLSGGGDLTATRSLVVDIAGTTAETSIDNADLVLIYDDSATELRSMTRSNFLAGIGVADEQVKVSGADTTTGFLLAKIATGNNRISIATLNPGANEQLQLSLEETNIDHDNLANYVANEHVDHSLVSIATAADSGLTGGGDLTATRNLSVDIAGTTEAIAADNADMVLIYDDSVSDLRSMSRANFLSGISVADELVKVSADDTTSGYLELKVVTGNNRLSVSTLNPGANEQLQLSIEETNIDHDNLANYVANEHIDHSVISVATAADSGLTGGGDLTATRNLSVDIAGTTEETVADNADMVLIYDDSATELRSMSRSNFLAGIGVSDEQVKVSGADTTPGFLVGKVVAGNNRLSLTTLSPGANEQLEVSVVETNIDHDNLANFVANEHVDHSLVSIGTAADSGLAGGGDLTATRSLTVDIANTTAETAPADADLVLIYDDSAGALRSVSRGNFLSGQVRVSVADTVADYLTSKVTSANNRLSISIANPGANEDLLFTLEEGNIDHDALANYVANEHVDHSAVSVLTAADSGLSGGGDLTSSRSLVVDVAGTTEETSVASGDLVLIQDVSAGALRSMTQGNLTSSLAFTPSTPGDWQVVPSLIRPALDTLASRPIAAVYVEAEVNETVISSTTFSPYHQETLTVDVPGDYYLTWDVIATRDSGQVRLIAEITLDTVRTTPWSGTDPYWFQPFGNNSSDVRAPYGLVGGIVTLGAGSHDFSLNLRANSGATSYTVHAAYMRLERLS